MRVLSILLLLFLSVPVVVIAQTSVSPYSGQQTQRVKALSAAEIEGYLAGDGLGMAKAAELNHFPGPKHVLDLAGKLALTDAQVQQTEQIYQEMHTAALRLGKLIVDKETRLDSLFAHPNGDLAPVQTLITEIAQLQGQLRFVHLRAHIRMRQILTPEQITQYDGFRGYGHDPAMPMPGHDHHH